MPSFEIESGPDSPRLIGSKRLNRQDFEEIANAISQTPKQAKKVGMVAGKMATSETAIETVWESEKTVAQAQTGDWIVTNMKPDRSLLLDSKKQMNRYVISGERFPKLYKRIEGESDNGPLFVVRESVTVDCLHFPAGLDIVAPWGERQQLGSGYLLRNGEDIYGNEARSFEGTYQFI